MVPARPNGSIAAMANPTYRGAPPYTGAWDGCAYDPELPGPIYTPDQVRVPPSLDEVVRLYSKAAIREQPENLVEWSRQWFTKMAEELAADRRGEAEPPPTE